MSTLEAGFENGLGDEISALLSKGKLYVLCDSVKKDFPRDGEILAINRADVQEFLEINVFVPFFKSSADTTLTQESRRFFTFFNTEKLLYIGRLNSNSYLDNLAREGISATKLHDAHQFAEVNFDKFSRSMGRSLLQSQQYFSAKVDSDFWSKSEEVSRGAVEYAIREGLPY